MELLLEIIHKIKKMIITKPQKPMVNIAKISSLEQRMPTQMKF